VITDITKYRKHVDQFDLTEEEKVELVNAVAMMVESFFDHHLHLNQLKKKEKRPQNTIDCRVQYSNVIGKATLNASKRKEVRK
jgi:hypothetical protein